MNQLSLQVVTWGMVASVVSAAVWLAMLGDSAQLERRELLSPNSPQAKAASQRTGSVRTTGYETRAALRAAERAPVSLTVRPPRAREDN